MLESPSLRIKNKSNIEEANITVGVVREEDKTDEYDGSNLVRSKSTMQPSGRNSKKEKKQKSRSEDSDRDSSSIHTLDHINDQI